MSFGFYALQLNQLFSGVEGYFLELIYDLNLQDQICLASLDLNLFVAGELEIISDCRTGKVERIGRNLRTLDLHMSWKL